MVQDATYLEAGPASHLKRDPHLMSAMLQIQCLKTEVKHVHVKQAGKKVVLLYVINKVKIFYFVDRFG